MLALIHPMRVGSRIMFHDGSTSLVVSRSAILGMIIKEDKIIFVFNPKYASSFGMQTATQAIFFGSTEKAMVAARKIFPNVVELQAVAEKKEKKK